MKDKDQIPQSLPHSRNDDEYVPVVEIARRYAVQPRWVCRTIQAGAPALRIGRRYRVLPSLYHAWLEREGQR